MGPVLFYALTRSSPEELALLLLPRARGQGWRVMLRCPDPDFAARLDEYLWLHPKDDFLPHGREGGPYDAEQPVLIGAGPAVNGAEAILLLGGAAPLAEELARSERHWVAFSAADEGELTAARALWSALKEQGFKLQYWAEKGGKWALENEAGGAESAGAAKI